jgi:REP element-mobilizing transposase RayT
MKIEYNNLYTHFIFTTQHRIPLILEKYRVEIEKYMTGIIKNQECHLYAIFANPDHTHILVSRKPKISEEELANIIANSSENFINKKGLSQCPFKWQNTCSAFSVSKTHVDRVCHYILNQAEHHRKASYIEEYEAFLKFYQHTINKK